MSNIAFTEENVYKELYENASIEHLKASLRNVEESIAHHQVRLNSEQIRKQVIQQLIEKEHQRMTNYYNSLEQ